jgi:hypothetical protein
VLQRKTDTPQHQWTVAEVMQLTLLAAGDARMKRSLLAAPVSHNLRPFDPLQDEWGNQEEEN